MIIVSQDKMKILNFENIIQMLINDNEIWVIDNFKDSNGCKLGKYKTENRAREVLEEITNMYKATESFIAAANRVSDNVGALAIQKGFAYYMPQE